MFFQVKYACKLAVSLCASFLLTSTNVNAKAIIVDDNAFLFAENVIAGISPIGAFGSKIKVPDGNLFSGSKMGYVSDPTRSGFDNGYDGDFFLPDIPEESWAISLNNTVIPYINSGSIQNHVGIPGEFTTSSENDRFSSVTWEGTIESEGLKVFKTFKTYNAGLAIIIDIELTNISDATITDLYYLRTVDADNNAQNDDHPSSTNTTTNTILQQGDKGTASVESTQPNGINGDSVLTLSAYTKRGRVSRGSVDIFNSNVPSRDPIAAYDGTNGQFSFGSSTNDASISAVAKFDQILPDEKVQFTMSYSLAALTPPIIKLDENNSSNLENGDFKQVYLLGTDAVSLSDDDILATTSTSFFDGLSVKIINPYEGDFLSFSSPLPTYIELDTASVNDSVEITLKGKASAAAYIEAIKGLRFENKDLNANLTPREITIQILDDDLSLSNSSEARVFITVPLVISTPLSGSDNTISTDELSQGLDVSGTTAPNSSVNVTLTDVDGTDVTTTTNSDANGVWTATFTEAQITSLEDGIISVSAQATDPNSNVTTESTTLTKDTVVNLVITAPIDQGVLFTEGVLIEGQSDPEASVVVTTTGGINCSATADSAGKWSCTLAPLSKGVTYPVSITATDSLNNQTTSQIEITVSELPLNVTSPLIGQDADDETPLISGTTEPNVDITVTTEFGDVCTTVSDQNGNWSCHLAVMPIGGPHTLTVKAEDTTLGTEITLPWNLTIADRPLIVTQPSTDVVSTQLPFVLTGTSNPISEVRVTGPNGESCITMSDSQGNWSCSISNAQTGDNQRYVISTTLSDGTSTEVIRNLNISTFSGAVETILEGGGSFGFLFFPVLLLIAVRKYYKHKTLNHV